MARILFVGGPVDGMRDEHDGILPYALTREGEEYKLFELADLHDWECNSMLEQRLYFYICRKWTHRGFIETLWAGYRAQDTIAPPQQP